MRFTTMAAWCGPLAIVLIAAGMLQAANLAVSIGIRETGGSGPIFSNGGSANGIEFVNLDGQTLIANGTWQLFTFTPATDTLTAFAGATANSVLDSDWGTLEMIRVRNVDGVTAPIRLWVDNVTNTDAAGPVVEGFESFAVGQEVMFQEPRFSGSTSAFLLTTPNLSAVTNTMAFAGSNSYQMDFQFVNNATTNWARLTTFGTPNLPNPAVHLREPGGPAPTISFYAKAIVIPEPASFVLIACGLLGLVASRRGR